MTSKGLVLPGRRVWPEVRARLAGPGGCYNVGNAIGLGMGVALQAAGLADGGTGARAVAGAAEYLAGNGAALALTAATAVFFWSGEVYHRAWARGFPPDAALNRRGDLLSGIGALALGVALLGFGQPLLAAFSGLLHALGKFGSAFARPGARVPGWPAGWPDAWRTAVLVSRLPAMLAALIELARVPAGAPWPTLLAPVTLLGCYLLWARADLLLFGGAEERHTV
jgi:hypothetical protein